MSTNSELADQLRGIADLLDLLGERFKPEAYRRAARTIESLPEDIRAIAARGGLDELPGVGVAIGEKIREFLSAGSIPYYDRIRATVPPGVLEIMRLSGLGPKTARRFWMELGIEGPAELTAAIEAGRLAGLSGFGPKKIENIRTALATAASTGRRIPLAEAYGIVERLLEALRSTPVDRLVAAGSFRRRRESVGDLDILATSVEPARVLEAFATLPEVTEVKMRGPTKSTVIVTGGVQVDLRVVEPAAFGAAWQYFTGSKDHNVELRSLARDRGLKINEYGVYRGEERIAGASEEEVYRVFELDWIPPEIREGRGEIAQAASGTLPKLVDTADLLGDLHLHVDDPDPGRLQALVDAAAKRHWRFLGIVPPSDRVQEFRHTIASVPSGAIDLLLGVEVSGRSTESTPAGADYLILRGGATPPTAAVAPWLVAHLPTGPEGGSTDPAVAGGWTGWARAHSAAIELTAAGAADGLDAPQAAAHVASGGTVHLASVARTAADGVLALGVARRAAIGPGAVLNARAPEALRARGTSKGARSG